MTQMHEGCICQYRAGHKTMRGVINGAGNRLQTVCKYGTENKTMRGVPGINRTWNRLQSVIMGLETRQ